MGKIIQDFQIRGVLQDYDTVVSTNGCFDILQVSHKRLLEQARALGDVLIVCVNTDESLNYLRRQGRPFHQLDERAEMLAALECTDYIVTFPEPTADRILGIIKPAIHVKGDNYSLEGVVERDTVEKWGGRVEILPIGVERPSRQLMALLGTSDERTNMSFELYDRVSATPLRGPKALNTGVVLSPDARLLKYDASISWKTGQSPDPLLIERDVTHRYGLMGKHPMG